MKNIKYYFFLLIISYSVSVAIAENFTLKSSDIAANSTIKNEFVFKGFGCSGDNVSPDLTWKNAPKETKSFALTMYDPDAPTGSGWWHWVVVNIPATVTTLPKNAGNLASKLAPEGSLQIPTDFGDAGYGGPCPPVGDKPHHYTFTIFALKVEKLELPKNATSAMAGYFINQNSIGKASFTAVYSR